MRHRLRAPVAVVAAALALGAAACSGSDDGSPDVTLPSSIEVPATAVAAPPTSAAEGTTTTTTAPGPAAAGPPGAPVVTSVTATVTDPTCPAGSTPVAVDVDVAPEPPVRVVTVFLDGTSALAAGEAGALTISSVPCDGAVHQVLVVVTGTDGASTTEAVALRTPPPAG